jgi:signal recognition particle receptor subunit alpha
LAAGKSGPNGRGSRRNRKAANQSANNSVPASSGDESSSRKAKSVKTSTKKPRKWDADGLADEEDEGPLDYSAPGDSENHNGSDNRPGKVEAVSQESWGQKTKKGEFVLKDLEDEVHSILSSAESKKADSTKSGVVGSSIGAIGGLFRNVVGGKVLTKEDLEQPMKGMTEHLLKKNVAQEAAIRLCDGVERSLIGVKTGNFQSSSLSVLPFATFSCSCRYRVDHQHSHGGISQKDPHSHFVP